MRKGHTVKASGQRFQPVSVGTRLGSWVCPSGNSVDVYMSQDESGNHGLWLYWDQPPPLLPEDRAYYLTAIQPELVRRIQERTGLRGGGLVVTVE